jgi:hypothetical protein
MFLRMKVAGKFLLTGVALVGLLMFAPPRPAAAQSCALCYTQAASSGGRMIQALKSGILILIVPPTVLSVGMIFVLYRKRYQVRPADDAPKSDGW